MASVCGSEDRLEKVKMGSITGTHSAKFVSSSVSWPLLVSHPEGMDHKAMLESREPALFNNSLCLTHISYYYTCDKHVATQPLCVKYPVSVNLN